jgi:hypothetical protein
MAGLRRKYSELAHESTNSPVRSRRRLQFSLRTMFVGVALASIPLAWAGYSQNWLRQRQAFIERNGESMLMWPIGPTRRAPAGLWLFGEVGQYSVDCPDLECGEARRLFPEATIICQKLPDEPMIIEDLLSE